MIQRGKNSTPPNHSLRINAFAKTGPLPPSNTCRSLPCCRDLACGCDINQCLVPHVGSMETLQTQPLPLSTATWEFLLQSFFANGIHSFRASKGFGKTRPNFTLYLLEKPWVTGEAAAAPKGGTPERLSCTTHPLARHGGVKARPWPRPGSTGGSATPLTSSKTSNLNHRAAGLWQTIQVCCCPGGLQVAGSPVMKESLNNAFKFRSNQRALSSLPGLVPITRFLFSVLKFANKYHNRI